MIYLHTMTLQNTKDLASGHAFHLSNTVGVTENDSDLRRCESLLCEFADTILNLSKRIIR